MRERHDTRGHNDPLCPRNARCGEAGSALVYILIAIALLAALTMAFMNSSSNTTSSQNSYRAVSEIKSQVDFIRAAVDECVLRASFGNGQVAGDININNTSSGTDPGANKLYPIDPGSLYFTSATVGPTIGTRWVRDIRCPSDPGDNVNHAPIFGGATGRFMPQPPPLFGDWQWYNGPDGVFFWTETTNTDPYLDTVLQKLNDEYAVCEADTIDASGSAENLDQDGTLQCPSGSRCFRVWLKADMLNGSGDVEDGDTDPEAANFPTPDADETGASCDIVP